MLQHNPPSTAKYHPNPLSHFLAMHQQHQQQQQQQQQLQQSQHHHQQQHNHHQHNLQQPLHNQLPFNYPPHLHHHQQQQLHHNHGSLHNAGASPSNIGAHMMDDCLDNATDTSAMHVDGRATLDGAFGANIGKSFTIAAILGLKKNAAAAAAAREQQQQQQQQQHHNHHMQHFSAFHPHHPSQHGDSMLAGVREFASAAMNLSTTNSTTVALNNNSHSVNNNNNTTVHMGTAPVPASAVADKPLHTSGSPGTLSKFSTMGHHLSSASSALHSLQQLQQVHTGAAAATHLSSTFGGGGSRSERSKSDHHLHQVSKKNSLKSKRVRTIFTPEQLERLESEFERQQYMVGPERLYLAHTLQLTEAQVKVWFQNRRIKWRKHHLELTQQKLALIRQHHGPGGGPVSTSLDGNHLANIEVSTHATEIDQQQQTASGGGPPVECDLSVCTDSMDTMGSAGDGDE